MLGFHRHADDDPKPPRGGLGREVLGMPDVVYKPPPNIRLSQGRWRGVQATTTVFGSFGFPRAFSILLDSIDVSQPATGVVPTAPLCHAGWEANHAGVTHISQLCEAQIYQVFGK
jgi:hypothetical protein